MRDNTRDSNDQKILVSQCQVAGVGEFLLARFCANRSSSDIDRLIERRRTWPLGSSIPLAIGLDGLAIICDP